MTKSELIDSIKEKKKESNKLMSELTKSLGIEDLWTDAFSCGTVTSYWSGNIYDGMTWTIKRPDGVQKVFTEYDVPKVIYETLPNERIAVLRQTNKLRKFTN